ncbi:LLM class flavin-dependent oxidoreductase [Xenophilus sp. Marseille-Q4582]|uniref:LLM class flavin-dependent oxidoreductase n=1 Tax=Xenophilus sp. Marseille-Q4582 TaxID=2866600 RepID=UPI001CE4A8BC|nr:LLM class flavin-dependent oxidoreductase [Xenophilus sp. Marseille-Q4582]
MSTPPQMHLGAFFFGVGHHLAAWRHPDVEPGAGSRIEALREWTRIAEAAKFDAIFFADNVGLPGPPDVGLAKNALWYPLDPMLTLAALSQHTTHIGLVATVSAT